MSLIAWFAGPATVGGDFKLQTTWFYYDPDDPANAGVSTSVPPVNILHPETFLFDPSDTDLQKINARVQQVGAKVAQMQTVLTGFNAAVPTGFPVIITGV